MQNSGLHRCETGKVIFKRKDLAHNQMLVMQAKWLDGKEWRVYRCETCNNWHFGHTPGQVRRRRPLKRLGVL